MWKTIDQQRQYLAILSMVTATLRKELSFGLAWTCHLEYKTHYSNPFTIQAFHLLMRHN